VKLTQRAPTAMGQGATGTVTNAIPAAGQAKCRLLATSAAQQALAPDAAPFVATFSARRTVWHSAA
jgi:hypothetical protein